MTRINEAIFDKLKEQAEKFDNQTLIWLEDRLSYHFEKLRYNTNKYMWTELFLENSDYLADEIDTLINNLQQYRDALVSGNSEDLSALLREGKDAKKQVG